jgi:ATP-dependent Clp protease ATP-binding subunit ClpC
LLFDEIEKAHADVYNLLLQILDEGHLTDSHGKRTSFRNAIIVMTSNVGVSEIKKTTAIGFGEDRSLMVEEESILAGMKKHFKPEFLNRIDNIIVFNSLSKENVKKIAKLQLDKFVKMLSAKGVDFKYNDDLVDFIVEKGYDPEFGARPIKRVIQKEVEDKVAEIIISSQGVREITAEMSEGRVKYDYLA